MIVHFQVACLVPVPVPQSVQQLAEAQRLARSSVVRLVRLVARPQARATSIWVPRLGVTQRNTAGCVSGAVIATTNMVIIGTAKSR